MHFEQISEPGREKFRGALERREVSIKKISPEIDPDITIKQALFLYDFLEEEDRTLFDTAFSVSISSITTGKSDISITIRLFPESRKHGIDYELTHTYEDDTVIFTEIGTSPSVSKKSGWDDITGKSKPDSDKPSPDFRF